MCHIVVSVHSNALTAYDQSWRKHQVRAPSLPRHQSIYTAIRAAHRGLAIVYVGTMLQAKGGLCLQGGSRAGRPEVLDMMQASTVSHISWKDQSLPDIRDDKPPHLDISLVLFSLLTIYALLPCSPYSSVPPTPPEFYPRPPRFILITECTPVYSHCPLTFQYLMYR
jgi:hypothetical protein